MKTALRLLLFAAAFASAAVAADFTVTNTNDAGPGSLFQAITDANNTAGADRVIFNIPGSGVHVIDVGHNPLPSILEPLAVDGYTQPGAKPNSLAAGDDAIILIQVDGSSATAPLAGFVLERGTNLAGDYAIRGLSITGFVAQQEQSNSPNTAHSAGILVMSDAPAVITGNFIGILPDGETAGANYAGVTCVGTATIGGIDPNARNIISGNTGAGVRGFSDDTGNIVTGAPMVQGNYIGTNARGTKAVGNGAGILLVGNYSLPTLIGGTSPAVSNLISGNGYGIRFGNYDNTRYPVVARDPGSNVPVKGNLIGVQADGKSPLPNWQAIEIVYGSNNVIGGLETGAGNVIAFNGSAVTVAAPYPSVPRYTGHAHALFTGDSQPSEGNQILSNSIYANGGPGIDLAGDGPTPNDPNDNDTGPNTLQNFPVITSTNIANGYVTIKGTLTSTANAEFTLQYFSESSDLLQPEQTYLGSSSVTTDAQRNAAFAASFPVSDTNASFNMTATSAAGNTSEFSCNTVRLRNISTRGVAGSGENALIGGFIVRGLRNVVVRALSPSLHTQNAAFGSFVDPVLEVHDIEGRPFAFNDDWRFHSSAAEVQRVGLAPPDDTESALSMVTFPGSVYTAVVHGKDSNLGAALLELYDIGSAGGPPNGELANLSTRGLVQTGDDVLIAGTITEDIAGSTRIVARALGPSLAETGVVHYLSDPTLELHDADGAIIAANDNWRDGQPDVLTAVGLAPRFDSEAALITRISAGTYTAIMRGKNDSTGVGLVELYNLH